MVKFIPLKNLNDEKKKQYEKSENIIKLKDILDWLSMLPFKINNTNR